MLQPVSVALKFGFLAVLYLFLMWVAWSAVRDLRRGSHGAARDEPVAAPADATGMYQADAALADGESDGLDPRLVIEHAPGHQPGMAYELAREVTLGRGDVEIHLEDPFASTHHARIFREGRVFVIEDLGSTNGTFLNDEPLGGPQPLHPGDVIRIGDSEFSFQQ